MKKHRNKIFAAAVALLVLTMVAADSFWGSKTIVATMHGETNYLAAILGNHSASGYRKISISNLVDVLEVLNWNYTKPHGYVPVTNFFTETNIWINPTARVFRITLTNSFGIVFTNAPDVATEFRLELKQDATGIKTGTTNSPNWRFGQEQTGMNVSTQANSISFFEFKTRGTNFYLLGQGSNYFD